MRRLGIAAAMVALLALGGWLGYTYLWLPYQAEQQLPQFETTAVARGSIASTVSATGSIEPEAEVSLTFRQPGRVTMVQVAVGQTVSATQLLASIDTIDMILAIAQAKIDLQISEAELAKLQAPVSERDMVAAQSAVDVAQANVAAAESALASAQAAYDQLLVGPTQAELTLNEAEVRQAEANLRAAQTAYDAVKNLPNLGALPQATQLERATLAFAAAQAKAQLAMLPPNNATLVEARNQIAQAGYALERARAEVITAQNNLAKLQEGPNTQDLAIANARVQQAQISQLQLESDLDSAQLVAPFDGVVSQVNIRPGEFSNTTQPDMVLLDLARFHMEVLVDEIDVRQVQAGQEVQILLDALPDVDLTGHVSEIAPTANDAGGVMAFAVTIIPDAVDVPLRAGMSATAVITTAAADNALLLPNQYIRLDRTTGQAYVYKLINGQTELHEVRLGLRNENASQILSGLEPGETVALVTVGSEEQLRGAIFGAPVQ